MDPVRNYHTIRNELAAYSRPLAEKPEIVCVSKAELTGADEIQKRLEGDLCREVFLISSVTGQGLSQVVGQAARMLAEIRQQEREAKERTKPVEFATEATVRTGPEATP
jgi:GTPase